MTTPNPMVAALQRLNGRECLINVETADDFLAGLTRFAEVDRAAGMELEVTSRDLLASAYGIDDTEREGRKPFVYQDGTGVIPVHGSLLNRFNSSWGFVTGYGFIRRQLNLMLDDDDVERIIFDINSPGGEASGCFELAREIMASRRVKPSLAMVDSIAASGGMAIAGAASVMWAIPSARIGSIGVYRQHISVEGALKDAGVKITFAQAGEHKTDGQPYKDLPESVLKDWTQDVEKTWTDFIELVAEARGMDPEDVKATQARVYRADEALDKGLINAVKTVTEAVPAFVAELAGDTPDDGDDDMDTKQKSEVASVDYEKIGAMISTGIGTAMSAMFSAQNRASAIKDHGKAKGQVALASKLVANDKIDEATAIELIDAAAVAAAPGGKKPGKGKGGQVAEPAGDDGDDDGDDNEDAEGGDGDEDEDEAEQARARRRENRVDGVNHLDKAMSRNPTDKAGAGNGKDGRQTVDADAAGTDALLGSHAAMTGTDLRKPGK